MPIHPSWEKIRENFKEQYGSDWESIWWAWMNKHGYDETKPAEGQLKEEEEVCKKCKEENDWERPPKEWFYECVESVSKNPEVDDPEALCAWVWNVQKKSEQDSEPDLSKEAVDGYVKEYKSLMEQKCEENGGEEVVEEMIYEIVKGIEEFLEEVEESLEELDEEDGETVVGVAG